MLCRILETHLVKLLETSSKIMTSVRKLTERRGPPKTDFPCKSIEELAGIEAKVAADQTKYIELFRGILAPEGVSKNLNRILSTSFKLSRPAVLLGWLVSLALLFTCIFAVFRKNLDTPTILEEAFYLTLTRIAWPLGLCWLVFACMQGYGGLANSFLSSPLWQPLSRLSYSAYIFHMLVESLNAGLTRTNTYFSDYQVMLRFWGDFGFVVLLAFAAYILIEAPFGNVEAILLPVQKPAVPAKAKVQPVEITDGVSTVPPLEKKSPLPPSDGV